VAARVPLLLRGRLLEKANGSAVVDRKYIGGSCPTSPACQAKTSSTVAKIASYMRRSKEFGIALDGFTIDMSGVRERKRKMVTVLL